MYAPMKQLQTHLREVLEQLLQPHEPETAEPAEPEREPDSPC